MVAEDGLPDLCGDENGPRGFGTGPTGLDQPRLVCEGDELGAVARVELQHRAAHMSVSSKRGVPYERATRLLAPLTGDLRTWREACGLPPDDAPVIPSGRGEPWGRLRLGQLAQPDVPRGRQVRRPACRRR